MQHGTAADSQVSESVLKANYSKNITEDVIFKSYNFFEVGPAGWQCRFSDRFAARMRNLQENQVRYVYVQIEKILSGNFQEVTYYDSKVLLPYNAFFYQRCVDNINIAFMIYVERIPVL